MQIVSYKLGYKPTDDWLHILFYEQTTDSVPGARHVNYFIMEGAEIRRMCDFYSREVNSGY